MERTKEHIHPRILPRTFPRGLYRITFRDQEGKLSDRETRAAIFALSVKDLGQQSQIVKVERIHPSTGEVLGGLYNE